jgi:hypothetical protein
MKRTRILAGAFLAGGLWATAAFGQVPAAGGAAAAGAPAAADAAAKPTFCEKFEKCIDKFRRKLCATPIGQMLNSLTKPLTAATGGIIPGFCPGKPSEEETKKPGAAGAAAQALKDAAEAKERRAAVRLLGTFDCHWHPEAEAGLAAALRTDRAECVRLEAAIALNRGCCCTRLIVDSLEDCVGTGDKYGPTENSPRVQAIAMMALEHCLQCPDANIVEVDPLEDDKNLKKGETPKGEGGKTDPGQNKPMTPPVVPPIPNAPTIPPAARGSGKPTRRQMEHARNTLAVAKARMANTNNPQVIMPSGQRSIAGLANYISTSPAKANSMATVSTESPKVAAQPVSRQPAATVVAPAKTLRQMQPVEPVAKPAASSPTAGSAYGAMPPVTEAKNPRSIDPTVLRCLETLRDADNPEIRHSAVQTLVSCNWRENPESVSGLVYSARYDKHPGMRVACIRSLAAMRAGTPEVMTGLKPMLADSDDWIRSETKQAMAYLQSCQSK